MTVRKSVDLSEMHKIPRKVVGQAKRSLESAVKQAGRMIVAEAKRLSNAEGIKDQGVYAKSWKAIEHTKVVQVTNTAPYAGVIESGAKFKRMPPVKKLIPWVKRKMPALDVYQRRRVAFAVAKTIQRRGLPAHNILARAIENTRDPIRAMIAKTLGSGLGGS